MCTAVAASSSTSTSSSRWPASSSPPRSPTTSSGRSPAGWATGSTPARPATPIGPPTTSGWRISSASPNIAARVYRAIDRPDLAEDPDYVDPVPRQQRAGEVDELVADWVGRRTLAEAMAVFEAASVAAAPIYDAEQLMADEHLAARGTFVEVDDPDLGTMTVQAPLAVLTETPGRVDHLGRHLGADSDVVYGELLGIEPDRLAALRAAGVI